MLAQSSGAAMLARVRSLSPGRKGAGLALLVLLGGAVVWAVLAGCGSGALAYQPQPGERLIYELDYVNVSAADFTSLAGRAGAEDQEAPFGVAHTVKASVKGELIRTVVCRQGNRFLVAYRMDRLAVRIVNNGELAEDVSAAAKTDLGKTVFAEVEPDGRIVAVWLPPGLGSVSAGLSRAILNATQVVLPGGPDRAQQWQVEQDDPAGTCLVHYRAERAGAGAVCLIRKTRRCYHPEQDPASVDEFTAPMTVTPGGRLEARFDLRRGRLLTLAGTESTTARLHNKDVGKGDTTLALTLLRHDRATAEELADLASKGLEARQPSTRLNSWDSRQAALEMTELGKDNLETLLAALSRAERAPRDAVNETPLYLKFKALAYLQPAVCLPLGERLLRAPASGVAMRVLTQALCNSGQPAAQTALVGVIRARAAELEALCYLVPALGMARAPTPQAEALLFELAGGPDWNTASTAQLALGGMAKTLARTSPRRASAIVRWAIGRLQSAATTRLRLQMLLVLGNTGSAEALPAIKPFLADRDPGLRGAAVSALRWDAGTQSDAILCRALSSDPHPSVRVQAVHAFEVRRMTTAALKAHARAIATDDSASVRLAVLHNLARVRQDHPAAVELIHRAARDPVKEVKEAAEQLLASETGEP